MSNYSTNNTTCNDANTLSGSEWIAFIISLIVMAIYFYCGFAGGIPLLGISVPSSNSSTSAIQEGSESSEETGSEEGSSEESESRETASSPEDSESSEKTDSEEGSSEESKSSETASSPEDSSSSEKTDSEEGSSEESESRETASSPEGSSEESKSRETASSPEDSSSTEETDPENIPPPEEFVDVPKKYWARPFIETLIDKKIVAGFPGGEFRPDQPVTRAELAAQIKKVFTESPEILEAVEFVDIEDEYWATKAIDKSVKIGFLKGYPGKVFNPEQPIPRVQVLVALAAGLKLEPTYTPATTLETYNDSEEIPEWATERVAAATEKGLVVNYPDKDSLKPNQTATRAEVAALIHQALVLSGKTEDISSEYVVTPEQTEEGKE